MKKLLFSLLAGIAMVSCANDTVSLEVRTKQGTLEGFEQDGVKTFLGIPFAQACRRAPLEGTAGSTEMGRCTRGQDFRE